MTIEMERGRRAPAVAAGETLIRPHVGLWLLSAAIVFAAAWVVGLLLSSGGPSITATAADIASYFAAHRHAAMLEHYLIDGVAGAALLVFAGSLRGYLSTFEDRRESLSSVVMGAGVAAGTISLVQAGVGEALSNHIATAGSPALVRGLFDLLNEADTFKMLALAVLIATVAIFALRSAALPAWLGWVSGFLAAALVVGGLGFVVNSTGLYAVLYVALPVLLLWVLTVGVLGFVRGRQESAAAEVSWESREAA